MRALLLAPLLLSSLACRAERTHFDLEEATARYEARLERFHRIQAEFEEENPVPQRFDFGDAGSVFVDEVELVGRPGRAFLRVHFTWVNTTGRAYPVVDLRLTLRDPETGTEWSESLEMRLPYRLELTPDSSYTSWFETPTHGVHLKPAWSWEFFVRPHERDPLWD